MIELLKNCVFKKYIRDNTYIDASLYKNRQEYYVARYNNVFVKLYLRNFSKEQVILHFVTTSIDPNSIESQDLFYIGNIVEFENSNKIGIYIDTKDNI